MTMLVLLVGESVNGNCGNTTARKVERQEKKEVPHVTCPP